MFFLGLPAPGALLLSVLGALSGEPNEWKGFDASFGCCCADDGMGTHADNEYDAAVRIVGTDSTLTTALLVLLLLLELLLLLLCLAPFLACPRREAPTTDLDDEDADADESEQLSVHVMEYLLHVGIPRLPIRDRLGLTLSREYMDADNVDWSTSDASTKHGL